jgi:hypothetical protein
MTDYIGSFKKDSKGMVFSRKSEIYRPADDDILASHAISALKTKGKTVAPRTGACILKIQLLEKFSDLENWVPSVGVVSEINFESSQPDAVDDPGVPPPAEAVGNTMPAGVLRMTGVTGAVVGRAGTAVGVSRAVGLAATVGGMACAVSVCWALSWPTIVPATEVYTALTSWVGSGVLPLPQEVRAAARNKIITACIGFISCMIRPPFVPSSLATAWL